jgi:glutathione S-transferase
MTEHSDLQTISITAADQPRPAINPTYPRLYGHALCPFVEATRITFAAKNLKYQFVELDLSKKTQWHLDINGGLVPILEFPDGTVILESKII